MSVYPGAVLFDLVAAVLRAGWNELSLEGKANTNDPVKFRMGNWLSNQSGYLGIISFDVLTGNESEPRHSERGFIGLAMDPIPTIYVHLQSTATSEDDATMVKVMSISARGVEFYVPVNVAGAFPRAIALRSRANGKLLCVDYTQLDAAGEPKTVANRDYAGAWETFDIVPVD